MSTKAPNPAPPGPKPPASPAPPPPHSVDGARLRPQVGPNLLIVPRDGRPLSPQEMSRIEHVLQDESVTRPTLFFSDNVGIYQLVDDRWRQLHPALKAGPITIAGVAPWIASVMVAVAFGIGVILGAMAR